MKSNKLIQLMVVLALVLSGNLVQAQGNSQCSNPTPFCTNVPVNYPASSNAGQAQQGPNYGCLFSQPNPAWFYLQMKNGGPVSISMSANNDIDFICWGPFSCLAGVCNSLTAANQVPGSFYANPTSNGCSYSGSPTETCTIANALPGQFYILLITNFSNSKQNITFSQTNNSAPGAGVTDCDIICTLTATNSGAICPGGTATLSATTGTAVTSYTWIGPGGAISNALSAAVTPTSTTTYTFIGTTYNGTCAASPASTCQVLTTVVVVPFPTYVASPLTTTVCQNGTFLASVVSPNNPQYSFQWLGATNQINFVTPSAAATIVNVLPIGTQTAVIGYTVVVTPTVLNCPVSSFLYVTVNNPPTPILSTPPPLCNISTQTAVIANPAGGTFFGNPLVNPNGIINPSSALAFGTFTVGYRYSIGACTSTNVTNVSISRYNSAAITGTIPNQCAQNFPINLTTIVLNPTGIWSGVNTSANTFSPANLPTGTYVLTYYNPSTPYANVCPASNSIVVKVFNPPIPTFSVIAPKCTNSPTVVLSAFPSGGVWYGNSGVSLSGIQTPSLSSNTSGSNTVFYSAGQGTCVAANSTTFHVSTFNPALLSVSRLDICATTNTIDLSTLANGPVTGTWSGGAGFISPSTFSPAGLQTNTYMVSYTTASTPNDTLCPDIRQLPIFVLNPPNPVIVPVSPICNADAAFQLQVSPNSGSFVPSPYLTAGGKFTPSLSTVGNNPVQYVIGTSTCNITDTKIINVEAFVPATITGTIADLCNTNGIVGLLNLSANTQGSWSGPGVVHPNFDPSASGTGSIPLMYSTASSPSGLCPDRQILTVNVFSLAAPAIMQEGPYCNSHGAIKLKVSPLGGLFGSSSSNAVDVNGWFNPAFAFVGDNPVNYSVTSGPCVAYTKTTIRIEKFVSADFARYAGPFCKDESPLDLNSIAQNPGGNWTGPGVSASMFTPAKANIGNTNIIIYRTHSLTQDLCPDSSAMRIQVNDFPNITIARDIEKGCMPVEVNFNTPNTNVGKGEWTLGDGSEPIDGLTANHTYTAPGTYSVVFNYWDEIGCSTQKILTNAVTVFEVPTADFNYSPYDEITIATPDVQFYNQTPNLGGSTYLWQIADMYNTTEVNPRATFSKAGEYRVSLKATTIDGCSAETSKILYVRPDFSVFIPNSFTPNFDGLNDVFMPVFSPYGLDPRTFEMEIFDRWGTSLYHTKDATKGWDGSMNNKGTEPLKQEVYVYKIKYKDLEGKIYTKMGSVMLLH